MQRLRLRSVGCVGQIGCVCVCAFRPGSYHITAAAAAAARSEKGREKLAHSHISDRQFFGLFVCLFAVCWIEAAHTASPNCARAGA